MTPTAPPTWPSDSPKAPRQPRPVRFIWQAAVVCAALVLVAGFVVTFQLARRAHQTAQTSTTLGISTQSPNGTVTRPGVGLAPTATARATATTKPNATATPTPRPGAPATATALPQENLIRVTQNQDMRPTCLDQPAPYTIALANSGSVTANWQVVIPMFAMAPAPAGAHAGSSPLFTPLSASPYWATANPMNGTIAPGQTASFVMNPVTAIPCGGKSYTASIKVSFAGGWQPNIPLSYAGTGAAAYSQVVLVSGTLNMTQPCPTGGATPAPFTFAITNKGNATAYPSVDTTKDTIGPNAWAGALPTVYDPPNPQVSTWLYAGETWTVTITPHAGVLCNGTVYHVYVYINNAQGTSDTMTFTETFQ